METKPPRSPVKDPGMKEYLLEQFKHDWTEIAHTDKIFHGLLKLYFTLLSGLWLGLSAIYAWKIGKDTVSQSPNLFEAMRTECIFVAGILLIMGIAIYLFHLSKRKGNTDARVDMMLIRAAFVQCSDNPEDTKKYLFFPPLEFTSPEKVKKLIKYSQLGGMDASRMYICALLNGSMLFALLALYKVPNIPLWSYGASTAGVVGLLSLAPQILIYWGSLRRFDKRLKKELSKRATNNKQ